MRRGRNFATATTCAAFFPQCEHRSRIASASSVVDQPTRRASACNRNWFGHPRVQIVSLKRRTRQEAVAFLFDHGITLATQLFQLAAVQHCDVPPRITDDAELV